MKLVSDSGIEPVTSSDYSMFPQDGKVVRVDSNKYFESLGYTSHHPRGSYRFKDKTGWSSYSTLRC